MDIKPLRYFITIAETGNFRRAAEILHLTQPPLSRQMAILEDSLGVQLLERGPRQVTLTAAGECFYRESKEILETLSRAKMRTKRAAQGEQGELRIGFTMCSAHTVIPSYVRTMRARHPTIVLILKEIISDDIPEKIHAGEIDVGVILEMEPMVGVSTATVLEEPMCVALSKDHARARSRKLRIWDLKDESYAITSASGSKKLSNDTLNFCRGNGFEPKVSFEVMLQQTMLSLVNEGSCIALLPSSMKKLRMEGIVFKPLENAPTVRQQLAWRAENLNPCLKTFLAACLPG